MQPAWRHGCVLERRMAARSLQQLRHRTQQWKHRATTIRHCQHRSSGHVAQAAARRRVDASTTGHGGGMPPTWHYPRCHGHRSIGALAERHGVNPANSALRGHEHLRTRAHQASLATHAIAAPENSGIPMRKPSAGIPARTRGQTAKDTDVLHTDTYCPHRNTQPYNRRQPTLSCGGCCQSRHDTGQRGRLTRMQRNTLCNPDHAKYSL